MQAYNFKMFLSVLFGVFLSSVVFANGDAQLYNDLGTGSNPRLVLTLSANGANWNGYTIDYQGHGGIPSSVDAASNWSSWNVNDSATNAYFGSITLK